MMTRNIRSLVLMAFVAAAPQLYSVLPAHATDDDSYDQFFRWAAWYTQNERFTVAQPPQPPPAPPGGSAASATAPVSAAAATFDADNYGATLQANEPTDGGKMKRTIWLYFKRAVAGRVVVATLGTPFDTDLAAYRGTALTNLVVVGKNDDKAIPGISTTQSLVQFNVTAGQLYHLQIGSKANVEDSVYVSMFVFPPSGGLVAWLATYGGAKFLGRDFVCVIPNECIPSVVKPTFLLYNATDATMTVTSSTDLGAGITVPAPVVIPRNGSRTVQFTFTNAFNKTAVRTTSGHFIFTGKAGSTVVATEKIGGIIVVKPSTLKNVLVAGVADPVRATALNAAVGFRLSLRNAGTTTALGCHARAAAFATMKVQWQEINPANGAALAGIDQPVNIPAAGTVTLLVSVASQKFRDGDPTGVGDVVIDCANTAPAPFDLRSSFDLTAIGKIHAADVQTSVAGAPGGVLTVPRGPAVAFRVGSVNRGPAAAITATPIYEGYYSDPLNTRYGVKVCRTDASGACLALPSATVAYTAAANVDTNFRVFVTAPTAYPAYDPAKRRVYLDFSEKRPAPDNTESVLVGAAGVAVK